MKMHWNWCLLKRKGRRSLVVLWYSRALQGLVTQLGIAFGLRLGIWGLLGGGNVLTIAYSKSVLIILVWSCSCLYRTPAGECSPLTVAGERLWRSLTLPLQLSFPGGGPCPCLGTRLQAEVPVTSPGPAAVPSPVVCWVAGTRGCQQHRNDF